MKKLKFFNNLLFLCFLLINSFSAHAQTEEFFDISPILIITALKSTTENDSSTSLGVGKEKATQAMRADSTVHAPMVMTLIRGIAPPISIPQTQRIFKCNSPCAQNEVPR